MVTQRRPSRNRAAVGPFPLSSISCGGPNAYRSARRAPVASATRILPGSPLDSSLLARFTVSPQRSYANFRRPITPATARPEAIPRLRGMARRVSRKHGWLQENGDGTQTCLAGCGQTFADFETAMNAEPLRFEESRVVARLGGRQRGRLGKREAAVR